MIIKFGKRWIEIKYNSGPRKYWHNKLIDGHLIQFGTILIIAKLK